MRDGRYFTLGRRVCLIIHALIPEFTDQRICVTTTNIAPLGRAIREGNVA